MCGISGILGTADAPDETRRRIAAMNAALAHRGPDGEAAWFGDGAAFGHRRLSIIDLSENGRQPMTSADGGLVLVCNGEIYNHRELRREFADYPFTSDTDVETILPAYRRYGPDCVGHLVGMFAFALWDVRRRRLFVARDRIGEKPLYYAAAPGRFAFASEIKALLTLPWVDRRLDESAVPAMLVYNALPAPTTIYQGIRLLPPASRLIWEAGRVGIERYWRIDFSRRRPWKWRDALDAYGEIMGGAVRDSLVADVPVGLMLSGGVDSSTVAAHAVKSAPRIDSFCLGSETEGLPDEEFARARRTADILGVNHRNIGYGAPGIEELPATLAQFDQPMSCLGVLYVDRLAATMRRHLKVVLTGNGGDEVFAGYRTYAALPLRALIHRLVRPVPAAAARLMPERWREPAARLVAAARQPLARRRGAAFSVLADGLLERLCAPAFARRWRGSDPGRYVAAAAEEANPQSLVDATVYSDLMVYHQHGHAAIPDISGMRYGLEMRSPFLNHHVVELAASLPGAMLIPSPFKPSRTKEIEKRWLCSRLPRDLVYARKVGFGETLDLERQIRGPWGEGVAGMLLGGRYLELGIFEPAGARWALANSFAATSVLLSFAIWAETALFGASAAALGERLAAGGGRDRAAGAAARAAIPAGA